MKLWHGIVGFFVITGVVGLYMVATQPIPGKKMENQGQEHVSEAEVAAFSYNSNPPTSGPHNPVPSKADIYVAPQPEGELIHALEHGHVIINYNCNVHLQGTSDKRQETGGLIKKVFAHEDGGEASPAAGFIDPVIATGSAVNDTPGCKELIKNLTNLATKNRLWKLIVVPRPQLDTTIALTAWTYIDKFDPPAGGFDGKRIEKFIKYHRDQGPEKTME